MPPPRRFPKKGLLARSPVGDSGEGGVIDMVIAGNCGKPTPEFFVLGQTANVWTK